MTFGTPLSPKGLFLEHEGVQSRQSYLDNLNLSRENYIQLRAVTEKRDRAIRAVFLRQAYQVCKAIHLIFHTI